MNLVLRFDQKKHELVFCFHKKKYTICFIQKHFWMVVLHCLKRLQNLSVTALPIIKCTRKSELRCSDIMGEETTTHL